MLLAYTDNLDAPLQYSVERVFPLTGVARPSGVVEPKVAPAS